MCRRFDPGPHHKKAKPFNDNKLKGFFRMQELYCLLSLSPTLVIYVIIPLHFIHSLNLIWILIWNILLSNFIHTDKKTEDNTIQHTLLNINDGRSGKAPIVTHTSKRYFVLIAKSNHNLLTIDE